MGADRGDPACQSMLGLLYFRGQGVPQDYVLAHKWLNLAASAAEPDAVGWRDQIASMMTSQQIAEAQRLARDWKPK
ncbi:hypothetical protein RSO01_33390 [Reyranella soli]|uniref:Sel1 repeat family protein n=2 Tax=Reyranella soli TaxID=1230389 RepID=A0A512NB62_9HYPH|nr:hypothetical protein RSO01_33390 [Reyranella soli]